MSLYSIFITIIHIAFSIFQLLPAFSQEQIYTKKIIQDFRNKNNPNGIRSWEILDYL